jgi:hypothetical protein
MKNFKEIVEKCAAGELYGTIILNDGREFYSKYLSQYIFNGQIVEDFYTIGLAKHLFHVDQIIDFIPNNMKEQIKIDIPEGKVPVMEQTESGVVITWKEKELICSEIYIDLFNKNQHISAPRYCNVNDNSRQFNKKVEVLRKLTNIRNYFGKPDLHDTGWFIMSVWPKFNRFGAIKSIEHSKCPETVIFKEKEHAEEAIKMLGDELKYLFELW